MSTHDSPSPFTSGPLFRLLVVSLLAMLIVGLAWAFRA